MSRAPETVVLLHGLWMHGSTMEIMRQRLIRRHGFNVQSFSYRSVRHGLAANVQRLIQFLRRSEEPTIHLVGHSLGGVLALRALEAATLPPGRVVCLGSPLTGSAAARALGAWPAGSQMLGELIHEAVVREPLTEYRGDRDVGVIAGRIGFGPALALNALRGEHDGAVTVEETRLPGIADHVVLSVTHTGMLLSRRLADQTAHFLRHGRFDAASSG